MTNTTPAVSNLVKGTPAEITSKLQRYLFPIEERKVYFQNAEGNPDFTKEYKSIVRQDNGKLISIMNDTYKVQSNASVILPVIEQLHNLDTNWAIDRSHSFITDNRMKLQVTFPDLTFNDGNSDVALSLFLHNSYDGSEGVRMLWGAIRAICTNGMVFGKVLARFYRRHTKNIQVSNISAQLQSTFDQIPLIKERIDILQNLAAYEVKEQTIEKEFGKNALKYVRQQPTPVNQWALYNILTYYISHVVEQHMRTNYQLRVSKMFGL